jgi:hypothetical protein
VVTSGQERAGEFGGGIIGVGHNGYRAAPLQSQEQATEFIEEGASVAGRPDHALVNACGHRDGQADPGCLHQQGDGLQGVAHDEGGFGIAARLLVETFDPRHFAAFLGPLETIDQHDGTAVNPHQATAEQALEGLPPE